MPSSKLIDSKTVGGSMSRESVDNVLDLSSERQRRVHDLNEKRLQSVRAAFVSVLPLPEAGAKPKKKTKKKR
ncbi:hypothetical protein FXF61_03640 [Pseudomonas sp. C27(2019)]|uniref:hypothetical protein n=1 Tax=Pseudomonas sp. C27(2019) TaxID=2604941 RepID=UPI00124919EF|nr:hypothetical protein [Pseudomonas sp. C27(2019)]QEY58318.1 hypothetical protein FXF61_03640 [Pseudomonas sp. C27(2019)]